MIKLDLNTASPERAVVENLSANYGEKLAISAVIKDGDTCRLTLMCRYEAVYGLGERFDKINHYGSAVSIAVIEKFCYQGELSYCPMPFFFTDSGFGVFAESMAISDFFFEEGQITIQVKRGSDGTFPPVVIFIGEPKTILSEFSHYTGEVKLPPKWAFGIWASANRWNKQADVMEQLEKAELLNLPLSVMVLEAWSDECTFYLWNGAAAADGSPLWENPKRMIEQLHERNIKLILWQIPVLKLLTSDLQSKQHDDDCAFAEENKLCVQNRDGTTYTIPEGNWFAGSAIPDFSNPKTREWWFSKRQYLLDMGVDGFKTDGGEFIYTDDAVFEDGTTAIEMRNGYVRSYVAAYTDFIGADRVLFSRAGYTGQHQFPIQWAGDQQSTWSELRSVLTAGLSAGLSGLPFWSYDIGGFAGALPTVELYERSTQMAVFCPVMQWHSEPSGGQFSELMPSQGGINDRSPWNMAAAYDDAGLLERLRFHYNLRTNLLPYIYGEALAAKKTGLPMMRHLVLEYPQDEAARGVDDQFMLGDLLVAPVLEAGQNSRRVYLPQDSWQDFYTGKLTAGGQWLECDCGGERIPVFLRKGGAVALNLGECLKLGSYVGNETESYHTLCFMVTGNEGSYHFRDDCGNDFDLLWTADGHTINGKCTALVKIL